MYIATFTYGERKRGRHLTNATRYYRIFIF